MKTRSHACSARTCACSAARAGCSSRSSSIRSWSPSSSASWCATRGTGPGSRSSTRTGSRRSLEVGGQRFDVEQIFDQAAEDVELVRLDRETADRRLATGEVLGVVVIPEGFESDLRGMVQQPRVLLRTTARASRTHRGEGAGARLRGQPRAPAGVHRREPRVRRSPARGRRQRRLLRGRVRRDRPRTEAAERLDALAESPDPAVRAEAAELANFVRQARSRWRPRTSRCRRRRTRSSSSRKRAAAARCSSPRTFRPTPWR